MFQVALGLVVLFLLAYIILGAATAGFVAPQMTDVVWLCTCGKVVRNVETCPRCGLARTESDESLPF